MFEGFSDATIDFMYGIGLNNEKSWFEAHKEEYLSCFYRPMKALSDQVYTQIDEAFPKTGLIHKTSRIYRDARRLHGRGPYKENLWFSIERPSDQWTASPSFWFELMPDHWTCGLGYYAAPAATMAKFRARIDRNPKKMEQLNARLLAQTRFALEGDSYARKKECGSPKLAGWYNQKSFTLLHQEKNSIALYSPDFAQQLVEDYQFLMPYYDYFITLDEDPDPRG